MQQFGVGSLLRYENFVQIGEGAYGHVYRAQDTQQSSPRNTALGSLTDASGAGIGTESVGAGFGAGGPEDWVALKRLIIPNAKEQAGFPTFAIREITFLKRLQHPNITRLLNIVSSKGCEDIDGSIKTESLRHATDVSRPRDAGSSTFLVFEYMEHDLSGLIDARYHFDESQCQFLALQLMRALTYLQQKRIMHRDVKSANVLVSNRLVLKLADFGMARYVHEEAEAVMMRGGEHHHPAAALLRSTGGKGVPLREEFTNNVVTIWYRPPELLMGETRYLWQAVDVWSAGCVLAELQLLRPLFPGKTVPEQMNMIMDVLGAPTEASWPGVSDLPHYGPLVQGRAEQQAKADQCRVPSFRASFEDHICGGLLSFIDRLLVLAPDKRMSPAAALMTNKYLLSCVESDVSPLGLVPFTSLHEFETKRNMRIKRAKQKQDEAQHQTSDVADRHYASEQPGATCRQSLKRVSDMMS